MPRSKGWTHCVKAAAHSAAGISHAVRTETAVRQECVLLILAVPAAILLADNLWKLAALLASVLMVLTIEFLNTCIEKICDHVTPGRHPTIKAVKDMGSAAVFCSICIAALVWICAIVDRMGFA